ncbi:hypothetical protein [Alkalihalobacterium alkalinitrilicum]|uniref:hypothetical protein n=1 Tax=Alkalihalobacterium alkalinitrilicum TaxID=427920 RepID=UPI000994C9DD|nr:hypothetical protein [Alkalihalobacterium alkalinitrilicum]
MRTGTKLTVSELVTLFNQNKGNYISFNVTSIPGKKPGTNFLSYLNIKQAFLTPIEGQYDMQEGLYGIYTNKPGMLVEFEEKRNQLFITEYAKIIKDKHVIEIKEPQSNMFIQIQFFEKDNQ